MKSEPGSAVLVESAIQPGFKNCTRYNGIVYVVLFFEYIKYIQQNDTTLVAFLGFWLVGTDIIFGEKYSSDTTRAKTMLGASGHVHAYKNQNCVPAAVINMLPKKCLDQQV